MSDLLIKGMEMPKDCAECPIRNQEFYKHGRAFLGCSLCVSWGSAISRADDCPLAELSTHGRLIDADELIKRLTESGNYVSPAIMAYIETAPTIIEAEQGDG